jgi:5'-3' exonuclease
VPGIGAKTAAVLLAHFETLDAILARIDEIQHLRFRGAPQAGAKLRLHRDQALLCRQLSTIALDAPLPADGAPGFHRGHADAASLQILCESLRFGPMTRRRLHAAAGIELAAVTGSD